MRSGRLIRTHELLFFDFLHLHRFLSHFLNMLLVSLWSQLHQNLVVESFLVVEPNDVELSQSLSGLHGPIETGLLSPFVSLAPLLRIV